MLVAQIGKLGGKPFTNRTDGREERLLFPEGREVQRTRVLCACPVSPLLPGRLSLQCCTLRPCSSFSAQLEWHLLQEASPDLPAGSCFSLSLHFAWNAHETFKTLLLCVLGMFVWKHRVANYWDGIDYVLLVNPP